MSQSYVTEGRVNKPSKSKFLVLLLTTSILAFIARMPFGGAEDIINARNNILTRDRSDFWGGFSPWFFTVYHGSNWEFIYAVSFTFLISLGSIAMAGHLLAKSKFAFFPNVILLTFLNYVVLLFALSFSRDGALISFTWFGIGGFLLSTYQRDSYCSNILKAISCLSLVIGFCFRPWLAFSLVVLIFLLRRFGSPTKKLSLSLNLAIVISLLFAPLIIDQLSKKIQSLESSFPEQQVMIMDASSMACLSASRQVSREAIEVLNYLPNSKDVNRKELCGEWFPQNWASTVFYGNSTEGHPNPLSMIPSNDFINYAKFRSSWLNLLGSNIPEYMQIKILLGSQFLLAGDSLNINVDSFKGMLLLPLELLKAFRLFSILPVLCLLFWLALRSRSNETTNRDKVATVNILTAFYLSFSLMSVISFIGDNQRYLFSGSIIVILFYFLLES